MPLPHRPARRLAALAATTGAALVLCGATGAVAGAAGGSHAAAPEALPLHARLASSAPADGSTVATAAEVVLTFSEEVNPSFVTVTVEGPTGDEADGDAVAVGRDVTQHLVPDLTPGQHVVTFRVVSADGHPVSGRVSFTTTQGPPSPGTSSAPGGAPTSTPSAAYSAQDGRQASAAPSGEPSSSADEGTTAWSLAGLGALVLAAALGGAFWRARRGATSAHGPRGESGS